VKGYHRLVACSLLLMASALGACSLAEDVTPPPGMDLSGPVIPSGGDATEGVESAQAPDLVAGAALYAEKCSPCHGPSGMGDGSQAAGLPNPATALGDTVIGRQAVPSVWYQSVTNGRLDRFMPGFAGLTDSQRWDVVAHALNLGTTAAAQSEAGLTYVETCADCHGVRGEGGAGGPALNDLNWMATRSVQQIYTAITSGVSDGMPAFGEQLAEAERWELATYVRNLAFVGSLPQTELAAATATVEPPPLEVLASGSPTGGPTPGQEGEGEPSAQPTPASTAEAPLGVIRGRVVQGTSGETVPSGLEVTLHGFDGQEEAVTQTTTVDSDGSYRFEGIDSVPGRLFVVTAEVDGVLYGTDTAHLSGTDGALDQTLLIFGTTADTSQLRIGRMHLLLNPAAQGVLEVIQLWLISNDGDRTVVPGNGGGVLDVVLPEGAFGLTFEAGTPEDRFALTGQGFTDTGPIRPGTMSAQLVFSFAVPYDGQLDLSQPVGYPVDAVVALVPEGDLRLSGVGVEDQGVRDMAGSEVHAYGYQPIAAGQAVSFRVAGRSASASRNTLSSVAIGVGVFGVALIAAGLWWYRRPGTGARSSTAEGEDRQGLLRQLADLDDAHEAGQMDEQAYRRRREAVKRRLMEILCDADD
jgi:mono/diheme cytochrome c family protein